MIELKCKALMEHFGSIKLMRRTLRAQWMLGHMTQMGISQKGTLTSKSMEKHWLSLVLRDLQIKILSFILLNWQNKKCITYLMLQNQSDLLYLDITGDTVQKYIHFFWKAIWQDYQDLQKCSYPFSQSSGYRMSIGSGNCGWVYLASII